MAHRRAPKAYSAGNAVLPNGSVGVPPCTHSWWLAAAVTCAEVSVVVTAPAMVEPVGLPLVSSSGTDAWVVNDGDVGFDTLDRLVPGVTPLIPFPNVKSQLDSGVQFGWLGVSIDGEMGWPEVYFVSSPRSWRLSWMLFRARLAVMSW